jgi:hypothetical protein
MNRESIYRRVEQAALLLVAWSVSFAATPVLASPPQLYSAREHAFVTHPDDQDALLVDPRADSRAPTTQPAAWTMADGSLWQSLLDRPQRAGRRGRSLQERPDSNFGPPQGFGRQRQPNNLAPRGYSEGNSAERRTISNDAQKNTLNKFMNGLTLGAGSAPEARRGRAARPADHPRAGKPLRRRVGAIIDSE